MKRAFFLFLLLFPVLVFSSSSDSTKVSKDYQIHLNKPTKAIKYMMYEKNFLPVQGKLSEDKKSIIIKDYQNAKVRVKVIYEDGQEEEFIRSPCFIDPVV